MGWDNNDVMNILNSQTIKREKFFIEKECEKEEDKECLTQIKETQSESSTILDKSTTTNSD